MEYIDFELEIGKQRGRVYPVAVLCSPAGEARSEMRLPFTGEGLKLRLALLENAVPLSGVTRIRKATAPEEAPVQTFGDMLFTSLFAGEVLGCYEASQRSAREKHAGLRIKLRILAPELAVLPWEFLYDGRHDEYLCLSRRTPLVRHILTSRPAVPLAIAPPLRILGMVASPAGLPPLDAAAERMRMARALGDVSEAGLVQLEWLSGQTWEALRDALWHNRWHVLHFVGHGSYDSQADEGLLALADESGNAHLLTATQIGHLLADNDDLRLVVLNACEGARGSNRDLFSGTAARLATTGGAAAVVAMQYEISDQAAIQFAKEFYGQVARGAPVDAAVAEARLGMSVETRGSAEWGTPVLYLQSPDGRIFDLPRDLPPAPAMAQREPTPPPVLAPAEPTPPPVQAPAEPTPPPVQVPAAIQRQALTPSAVEAPATTGRTSATSPFKLVAGVVAVGLLVGAVWFGRGWLPRPPPPLTPVPATASKPVSAPGVSASPSPSTVVSKTESPSSTSATKTPASVTNTPTRTSTPTGTVVPPTLAATSAPIGTAVPKTLAPPVPPRPATSPSAP